ncbi:UvrD-helicase domain-containing protein [Rhizobium changzhiense]|uniref:UvrD-helicase domain-containing protein n=1 Tax=Rhizobium changzhiense TaxID=2692317 RepID=UPI001F0C9B45|nr:UvrD-helicase domain-containing protein [Rhizobium changzhiense]
MRSRNRIVIAAAGGGKTTRIADEVLADKSARSAIVTYTRNNVREIQAKFYQRGLTIPQHVEIIPWYTFLLRELARPYRNYKYEKRIDGIFWTETTVDRFAPKADVGRYYFGNSSTIYSNRLAEFICDCNAASGGAIFQRLEQRFKRVYIDEIQDIAGYDIDIIELLLRSSLEVVLVGDPRQSTYVTNNSARHKGFRGRTSSRNLGNGTRRNWRPWNTWLKPTAATNRSQTSPTVSIPPTRKRSRKTRN